MAYSAGRKINVKFLRLILVFVVAFVFFGELVASANQNAVQQSTSPDLNPLEKPFEEAEVIKPFNEVLQDLVNELSFDLRAKALNSIRTLAIRRVALGEGIPRSYESYLETQVSDSVRKHSGTKVLQCTNCRIRRTIVENGRLVMTTPINNPQELDSIAVQLGVEAWVDVSLLYQETSMVLGLHVFDSKQKNSSGPKFTIQRIFTNKN